MSKPAMTLSELYVRLQYIKAHINLLSVATSTEATFQPVYRGVFATSLADLYQKVDEVERALREGLDIMQLLSTDDPRN